MYSDAPDLDVEPSAMYFETDPHFTAALLKRRRKQVEWSQRELAEQAGVHEQTVKYWEGKQGIIAGRAVERMSERLAFAIMFYGPTEREPTNSVVHAPARVTRARRKLFRERTGASSMGACPLVQGRQRDGRVLLKHNGGVGPLAVKGVRQAFAQANCRGRKVGIEQRLSDMYARSRNRVLQMPYKSGLF